MFGIEVVAPHVGQDRRLRDDPAGVAQQVFEQRELARAQLDRLRAALHLARQQVEREVAGRQPGRLGGAGRAADERLHARQQFREGERLGQVVVAARLQAADAIVDGPPGAEDQDRHPDAPGAERVDQGQPIHLGQHDVDDGRVVGLGQRLLEPGSPVRHPVDRKARLPESLVDEIRNGRVVLHQKDSHHLRCGQATNFSRPGHLV